MHTAFSSPSSAPAAPLMPVSDAVQERFIRLPEVMHLCGLSSTIYDLISREAFPKQISLGGKTWRGRSRKSPDGWRIALPNATGAMTHDDARSAKAPFLACFPSPFPDIVLPLSQNRQPGVRTRVTQWRHRTRHASFCVYAYVHLLFTHRFLSRCCICVMVAQAGQPSGWPVPMRPVSHPVWATTRA